MTVLSSSPLQIAKPFPSAMEVLFEVKCHGIWQLSHKAEVLGQNDRWDVSYHLVMTYIAMENRRTKWWFLAGKIIYK